MSYLIADGDVSTKGDREETYREMLGDRFLILETKEIENLIPLEVLKEAVAKKFQERDKNTELIKYEDYAKEDTPIGRYLNQSA